MKFNQGDIIKIAGYSYLFLIVSKNAFIDKTSVFHVCPVLKDQPEGPLHIKVYGQDDDLGTVICEQLKLIDPDVRRCSKSDRISYDQIMNVSDAVQGIFEYD